MAGCCATPGDPPYAIGSVSHSYKHSRRTHIHNHTDTTHEYHKTHRGRHSLPHTSSKDIGALGRAAWVRILEPKADAVIQSKVTCAGGWPFGKRPAEQGRQAKAVTQALQAAAAHRPVLRERGHADCTLAVTVHAMCACVRWTAWCQRCTLQLTAEAIGPIPSGSRCMPHLAPHP